ncbi:MAG: DUF1624 domain-containing protein, partial [Clostridia bacterium]|nr:DUF1624 domain-containing protein [Clostridia bacterium]
MAQKYDRSLDAVKGLAVVLMVLCHGLLLLSDTSAAPWAQGLCDGVNLIAFPTFLFSFGRTVWLAYVQKPYAAALPSVLRTALRC